MFYRAIGIMSGSSLDGLDICYAEFDEIGGQWAYEIKASECIKYESDLAEKLQNATQFSALAYMRLHTAYGHLIGKKVNEFIAKNNLQHKVQLIGSHGHTTFHEPEHKMTGQIGDGAAIAAETGINTVSDLRAMDLALGGQGAPIVPIGEKLLMENHAFFLNLGGIANLSSHLNAAQPIAFDICPANRILNILVQQMGHQFDAGGSIASTGKVQENILQELNQLNYYSQPFPKSLANNFGTELVFPIINKIKSIPDALATMVEHVAQQIANSCKLLLAEKMASENTSKSILATGGGAFNHYKIERIKLHLQPLGIEVIVADEKLIEFKESLIMALMAVLRWREENNVLNSVTGASRSSIGGAVWIGQEA